MAENSQNDSSQKSFEATEHRLQQARERGQIPLSNDFNIAIMIFASAIVTLGVGPSMCGHIGALLSPFIEHAHAIRLTPNTLRGIMFHCIWGIGKAAFLIGVVFLSMALLGAAFQTHFVIAWERLKPDLSKLSIKKGFERLFSWKGGVEFLKNILKFCIAGTLVAQVLWSAIKTSSRTIDLAPLQWLPTVRNSAFKIFLYILIFMSFIGGLDYLHQWLLHRHQLRMTHQERREEFKQLEGDPHVRAKIRQIRNERTKQHVAKVVQDATVIITSLAHYAVVLKYEVGTMSAPIVTAKGIDFRVQIIKDFAREANVPIIENPLLARTLYTSVKVDQEVPQEQYKAVAAVIQQVLKLKGKLPS
ncbi:MAG: flagellar type III secretion system protein FlhB [Holosporales bacterium]|jgi:flagellar biosynthetic protein FlhB|nr:flagellar type III secretion system protein FlhB [Holosporales bacterium]